MSQRQQPERIERYPDGRIPASRRYIDYDGQLIIRTRYATVQRFKSAGWDGGRMGHAPYILGRSYCTGESETLEPRNEELEPNQLSLYYVEGSETKLYEVVNKSENTKN
jgi:hypothetical protein